MSQAYKHIESEKLNVMKDVPSATNAQRHDENVTVTVFGPTKRLHRYQSCLRPSLHNVDVPRLEKPSRLPFHFSTFLMRKEIT